VGVLIHFNDENYRLMFVFSAVSMALAGFLMARVRGGGEARVMRERAEEFSS
jgi:hypothetical protein